MTKFRIAALALAASTAIASPAFAQNLITNGDFSAGTVNSAPGWTVNAGAHYFDGSYREGTVGREGSISQTFAANAGDILTLDYDFFSGGAGYGYTVFNGNTIAGSLASGGAGGHFTFNLGAALASNTLSFFGRNDPSYNTLDNVVVTAAPGAVPEPATWAMMIVGVGVAGFALRRRQSVRTSVSFA